MNNRAKESLLDLKELFIKRLDDQCEIYKAIGMGHYESPIWFVYGGIIPDELKFVNSQKSSILFTIPVTNEQIQNLRNIPYEEITNYFKYLKYDHIINNHKGIWEEDENNSFNKSRILSFLANYKEDELFDDLISKAFKLQERSSLKKRLQDLKDECDLNSFENQSPE